MKTFKTLLLREWMQHQRGWLILIALPILIFALAGTFGQMHFDMDEDAVRDAPGPLVVALGTIGGVAIMSLGLAWLASMLQSPGLARRDVQDRSLEFWLSLPTSHTQSLAAPLLMHLLLVPWLALAAGLAGGLVVSLLIVAKHFGIVAWFTLPWGSMLAALLMLALRVMVGLVLASLWLSPLILGTMAASAWLKRWGVPVVVGVVGVGGLWLDKVYGNPVVWRVLQYLGEQASLALFLADRSDNMNIHNEEELASLLHILPGWALSDTGSALAALASPGFVGALAAGAAAFALLWLRRRRGA